MKEKLLLKDILFNTHKVHKLAVEIKAVYVDFNYNLFEEEVLEAFALLELKERIEHIRIILHKYLPQNYVEAMGIIKKALPNELDSNKSDNDFGDFIYSPYASYVVAYGCNDRYLNLSLSMLRELTKRFSVEFVIRDFLNHYPEETLTMLQACALSNNYHERRLASEGLRPKLPWAKKLTLDYRIALRILDTLFYDRTRYVTRSVANHLNDISKIDAVLVLNTLKRWKDSSKQEPKEMEYIISHALRTLVKKGNTEALILLGYKESPDITVSHLRLLQEEIFVGEVLEFDFHIKANETCNLIVDYSVYFQTKTGNLSAKVFKLKRMNLQAGEDVYLNKKHFFKANMTTRRFYEGEHKVILQINGKGYDVGSFRLKMPHAP